MPDISKITLPSGTTYDLKDATAREAISALAGGDAVVYIGVSSTEITDEGSETPTINGETVTPEIGNLAFYETEEFVWDGSEWHLLGNMSNLGALAQYDTITVTSDNDGNYTPSGTISGSGTVSSSATSYTPAGSVTADNGSGDVTIVTATEAQVHAVDPNINFTANYTPAGSVGTPTISVSSAGSTSTIHNPTKATVATAVTAAAPGATAPDNAITYYSVSNETLSLYQIGYTTGDSITTSDVTVKTGDASYSASTPAFTGTPVFIAGSADIPTSYTFTGTSNDISVDISASDIGSALSFTGDTVNIEAANYT